MSVQNKNTCDLMINAKWLITCENENVLHDHSLIIDKGKITQILPTKEAIQTYQAAKSENFSTHAILPGFINTHTHLAMNWFRGLADDTSLMDWLNNYIWPNEKKWVSNEFVKDASLFAMAEMIRSGSICFNDMYFFLDETAEAADSAGIRGSIGITVIDFPTPWANDTEEYFSKGLAFLDRYKNHERINVTFAPHSVYTVSDKNLLRVKEIADKHKLRINIHVQETADEVSQSIEKTGVRPIQRLSELGLMTPDMIAVHLAQIDAGDLEILEKHKPQIVHCPESNMKLASGVCPVKQLQAAGLNVALGTDGAASNNDLDMIGEMRTATFLAKLVNKDPRTLSASHVIKMATLNGAKALGIDAITGSLKPGKSADFIAIDLNEIETLPLYHPASQIVYSGSRNQVTDMWVMGKRLLQNRKLLTLDEDALKQKAQYWAKRIGVLG